MTYDRESWQIEPASSEALSSLIKAVPMLPKSYLDFLARGNGGEVQMPEPIF